MRHVSAIPWSSLKAAGDLKKVSLTQTAFAGCPLSQISPQRRGCVLEWVARRIFERRCPDAMIQDPIPGERCDGRRRGANTAEYDWLCDGRKVQCKSGQMCWVESHKTWRAQFNGIKLSLFDELILVLYSPSGLHFFTHDCKSGLSTCGVRTACDGLRLVVYGQRGLTDWREAEGALLNKLQDSGQRLAHLKTSDDLVAEVLQNHTQSVSFKLQCEAYAQHPFNSLMPAARGLFCQRVVQEVDLLCHPGSEIATSTAHRSYDWHRDGLRIECKHSRLLWSQDCWRFMVSNVKFDKFDALYLALDSPQALHIFRFSGSKWIASKGLAEEARGKQIRVFGRAKEANISFAVDVITEKLLSTGSEHVASVVW